MANGLFLLFTGNGKGKTTAALGLAFRALGHGKRVCMIQFLKGSWHYGELDSAQRFSDLLDWHVMGRGFTWKSDDKEKDREKALAAWDFAKKTLAAGEHSLVILDELTYLVTYGILTEQDVVDVLKDRPKGMHVVVTGRNASDLLVDAADLVTEMVMVKHPYQQGIKAQKGIEF